MKERLSELKSLISRFENGECTQEDREQVAAIIDTLATYKSDINDLKAGYGILYKQIQGLEKE